jgi:hypothetical protein
VEELWMYEFLICFEPVTAFFFGMYFAFATYHTEKLKLVLGLLDLRLLFPWGWKCGFDERSGEFGYKTR